LAPEGFPRGEPQLGRVKHQLEPYPQIWARGCRATDEARFPLGALTKPAHHSDTTYVAGRLFRVGADGERDA
jgi:hypothetical protein